MREKSNHDYNFDDVANYQKIEFFSKNCKSWTEKPRGNNR